MFRVELTFVLFINKGSFCDKMFKFRIKNIVKFKNIKATKSLKKKRQPQIVKVPKHFKTNLTSQHLFW